MNQSVIFLILMFIGGFAGAGVQQKETPLMNECPLTLPGTSVATSDTAAGISIELTTQPDSVVELRRRVERMAAMHRVDGKTVYEEINGGARLILTPHDPEKLTEFRNQVRAHVEQMKKMDTMNKGCSMMHGMMKGTTHGMMEGAGDHAHHTEGRP